MNRVTRPALLFKPRAFFPHHCLRVFRVAFVTGGLDTYIGMKSLLLESLTSLSLLDVNVSQVVPGDGLGNVNDPAGGGLHPRGVGVRRLWSWEDIAGAGPVGSRATRVSWTVQTLGHYRPPAMIDYWILEFRQHLSQLPEPLALLRHRQGNHRPCAARPDREGGRPAQTTDWLGPRRPGNFEDRGAVDVSNLA